MMYRDHSRTFYQKAMADIFANDLVKRGANDVIITSARDISGFTAYTVCWNIGWSLND